MLLERLCRFVVNFSYYNSFLVGLLPAPLDLRKQEFRSSRIYLAYSAFTHLFSIFANIFGGYYYFHSGFMTTNLVLMWTYVISNTAKILFTVVLFKELWCKREVIMGAYNDYCALDARYNTFLNASQYAQMIPNENGAELMLKLDDSKSGSIKKEAKDCEAHKDYKTHNRNFERRISLLIILKFFIAYSCLLMTAYNFLTMHPGTGSFYLPITYISFILNAFMLSVLGHFFFVLCQLYRQFSLINSELHILFEQLQLHQEVNRAAAETTFSWRINTMATLHRDTFCLAQRIFTIGELTLAAFLLRLFFVNMRTVYSACLLLSQNLTEGLWSLANDLLLTVFYFGDTALVMGMLDAVLEKCNGTGQVLKEYGGLSEMHNCLRRELDSFSSHLSCHKLRYKVCGLFEFNKEAALQFFLMVLVKVTVLVQFDMQNKLIECTKSKGNLLVGANK